ncbi:MAG: DNA cytosine methyltransferase [Firmicutes bacterium]|nr:DNA cytosine methyltransferase [Bacillota bacterium]
MILNDHKRDELRFRTSKISAERAKSIRTIPYILGETFASLGGLQSANRGHALKSILDDLAAAGPRYLLTPHLYKFEDYGVPQTRHRIIIVGIRSDLGLEFKIPAPTHAGKHVSAREAIESPPIAKDAFNHEFTEHSPRVVEMLDHIPAGENAWYEGIPEQLRLNVKRAKLSHIYRRLDPDKPAYTVTGTGGGGTHVYHWSESRALTNRERARLQTFEDSFEFIGPKESVRKQIGMAVPPHGAKVIFEALLKTFAGVEYEYVTSEWFERFGYR